MTKKTGVPAVKQTHLLIFSAPLRIFNKHNYCRDHCGLVLYAAVEIISNQATSLPGWENMLLGDQDLRPMEREECES